MRLHIENLQFAYNGVPTLADVDLDVQPNELLALVGPNGSGKTTLLKLLSGALAPDGGAVYLNTRELSAMRPREIARLVGALEQERTVGFDFTARELVEWGRTPHRSRLARWSGADERAVRRAISVADIEELTERSIGTLSGGERQRVFLAIALAQEPDVLLLDEPTTHLDLRYQMEILDLIRDQADAGLAVVAALHDLNLAARYADRVAVLHEGELVALGSPRDVLTEGRIEAVWEIAVRMREEPDGLWIQPCRAREASSSRGALST